MLGDALALIVLCPGVYCPVTIFSQNVQLLMRLNLGVQYKVSLFCSDKFFALVYFVFSMYERDETLR